MGGDVVAGATACELESHAFIVHIIVVGIVVEVVVGIAEARTPERLTETRRAALHATARVMDTPDGSPAIPTGEVDDPAGALHLVPPTDGIEKITTDRDGIGQTADLVHHLSLALWAHGHGDSSFALRCRPCSVALGCDICRSRARLHVPIPAGCVGSAYRLRRQYWLTCTLL
jgi:hypothetical protein